MLAYSCGNLYYKEKFRCMQCHTPWKQGRRGVVASAYCYYCAGATHDACTVVSLDGRAVLCCDCASDEP